MVQVKEYGEWESPLKSDDVVQASNSIVRMYFDRFDSSKIYWDELRPTEGGMTTIFSKNVTDSTDGTPERWTPQGGCDVYDMVHEYGGAAYMVNNDVIYFSNLVDNCIYTVSKHDRVPKRLTQLSETENPGNKSPYRYADMDFSRADNFFFCVREDHYSATVEKDGQCRNTLVAINTNTAQQTIFASGNDFYSTPRVSPDGKKVAYITWVHNNMPWDETQLYIGHFHTDGEKIHVGEHKKIAGEENLNLMEPRWTADGKLLVVADKDGWWNLYEVQHLNSETPTLKCVHQDKAQELGSPCWDFGYRSYFPNPKNADQVAVLYGGKPALLSISSGSYNEYTLGVSEHASYCIFSPDGAYLFLQVVSPMKPSKIVRINVTTGQIDDFYYSGKNIVEEPFLSVPVKKCFDTPKKGSPGKAYGYYYPPKNGNFKAPDGSLPPVLLKVHGGPTAAASLAMDLQKQYFTSRGIAIFDMDYRGSTGYGTAYRNLLKLKWGVYDIEDCLAGALYLVSEGLVDVDKLLISGGSSGGYTTLACLTFDTNNPRVFAAGTSYYGICDLSALAEHTHKFESHCTDTMIAPYPEQEAVYKARSPLFHTEQFKNPCCFFQGLLDKVVPPEQSQTMYTTLKDQGTTCAYVSFDDEEHGFKKAENKKKALDGEFYFYSQILGFEAADPDIEIPIDNLPEKQNPKKRHRKNK